MYSTFPPEPTVLSLAGVGFSERISGRHIGQHVYIGRFNRKSLRLPTAVDRDFYFCDKNRKLLEKTCRLPVVRILHILYRSAVIRIQQLGKLILQRLWATQVWRHKQ